MNGKYAAACQNYIYDPETTTTIVLRPFFWDYPGEPVPEEKLLNFMVQGKIYRGKQTDHPAGCHSIWTNQTYITHKVAEIL